MKRIIGAGGRAFLVAVLIALPALMLHDGSTDRTQMIALLALIAAILTFSEYVSAYPSFLEFRDAGPFNRLRFAALFATVFALTMISRGQIQPTAVSTALGNLGGQVGQAMDFPFSPVRLMVLLVPSDAPQSALSQVRTHAGLAYLMSLLTMLVFVAIVRLLNWPIRRGSFNFWVNLPLFDPTAGGDVLRRLKRDAHVNVALGFLLPFLIPAAMSVVSQLMEPVSLSDPQTLIWTMSAWAFLPAGLMMRGVALMRIADLIEEKRRRAYAQADLQIA
ncbi:hypothetical protein [Puniceibacterium sp. IMCC21224]|uniref:hypothetical protein n=1 Tax=Puniceibacterium sp. IMCC21224 TaxID=1618204 RepID=UPI00065DA2BA|nr:hypothetical protein [Puniceibacterium sp. IMCC21224]KMK66441.1 hypothetical protein IMCC21224_111293 [Puniceibacterium sp. IMCC21224]